MQMHILLLGLFLSIVSCQDEFFEPDSIYTATYFIAPDGKDINPGTIDKPFSSIQRAVDLANPGDTILIREGVYYCNISSYNGVVIKRNGTETNYIKLWAYPGEKPVLDCGNSKRIRNINGIYFDQADYWHIKGLEIRNSYQTSDGNTTYLASGITIYNGKHNIIEQVYIHDIGGFGISVGYDSHGTIILNSDISDCYDPLSLKNSIQTGGIHADGIRVSNMSAGNVTRIKGCRIWNISDDGIDCFDNDGIVYIEDTWSFDNGKDRGAGNGFKLGPHIANITQDTLRFIFRCMSFNNKGVGFTSNTGKYAHLYYHNIAYNNGSRGFQDFDDEIPDVWKNNISYGNRLGLAFAPNAIQESNSWNGELKISIDDKDFISLNSDQVMRERNTDGSLPVIDFLKPAPGSDLVDNGIDVGWPYSGNGPNLGPYE